MTTFFCDVKILKLNIGEKDRGKTTVTILKNADKDGQSTPTIHTGKVSTFDDGQMFRINIVDPLYDKLTFKVSIDKGIFSKLELMTEFPVVMCSLLKTGKEKRVVQQFPLRKASRTMPGDERGSLLLEIALHTGGGVSNEPRPSVSLCRDVPGSAETLCVRLVSATGLALDNEPADLAASVVLAGTHARAQTQRTTVHRKTQFAVWNQSFGLVSDSIFNQIKVNVLANGKSIGALCLPVAPLHAAFVALRGATLALDFWWPLLAKNAATQAQNTRRLGSVHCVLYYGPMALQQPAPPPMSLILKGSARKMSTKNVWIKRVCELQAGGGLPPMLWLYHGELKIRAPTTICIIGARIGPSLLEHENRSLAGRTVEIVQRLDRSHTLLFETTADAQRWRDELAKWSASSTRYYDARLLSAKACRPGVPRFSIISGGNVRATAATILSAAASTPNLPQLSLIDEDAESPLVDGAANDGTESDQLPDTTEFVIAPRGEAPTLADRDDDNQDDAAGAAAGAVVSTHSDRLEGSDDDDDGDAVLTSTPSAPPAGNATMSLIGSEHQQVAVAAPAPAPAVSPPVARKQLPQVPVAKRDSASSVDSNVAVLQYIGLPSEDAPAHHPLNYVALSPSGNLSAARDERASYEPIAMTTQQRAEEVSSDSDD